MNMTTDESVKTSVTNGLSQDYTNLDNLPSPTCTVSPGIKPFTFLLSIEWEVALSLLYNNIINTLAAMKERVARPQITKFSFYSAAIAKLSKVILCKFKIIIMHGI